MTRPRALDLVVRALHAQARRSLRAARIEAYLGHRRLAALHAWACDECLALAGWIAEGT
jgi:hypothetical protein